MQYFNLLILLFIIYFILKNLMPTKGVKQITSSELKIELKNKSIQLIDVRTPAEYKGRHIKEFKNIPLNQLIKNVSDLSTDRKTIVICQSGMRSKKACKILKQMGFTNITNVKGGMSTWY